MFFCLFFLNMLVSWYEYIFLVHHIDRYVSTMSSLDENKCTYQQQNQELENRLEKRTKKKFNTKLINSSRKLKAFYRNFTYLSDVAKLSLCITLEIDPRNKQIEKQQLGNSKFSRFLKKFLMSYTATYITIVPNTFSSNSHSIKRLLTGSRCDVEGFKRGDKANIQVS